MKICELNKAIVESAHLLGDMILKRISVFTSFLLIRMPPKAPPHSHHAPPPPGPHHAPPPPGPHHAPHHPHAPNHPPHHF